MNIPVVIDKRGKDPEPSKKSRQQQRAEERAAKKSNHGIEPNDPVNLLIRETTDLGKPIAHVVVHLMEKAILGPNGQPKVIRYVLPRAFDDLSDIHTIQILAEALKAVADSTSEKMDRIIFIPLPDGIDKKQAYEAAFKGLIDMCKANGAGGWSVERDYTETPADTPPDTPNEPPSPTSETPRACASSPS